MPQSRPMPGEIYRHFKNKNYQIIAVATHSETREPYVVYQALYGDFMTYIRPYDMFISEVDHVKYPDIEQKYRFAYVGTHAVTEAQQNISKDSVVQKTEMRKTGDKDDNQTQVDVTSLSSEESDTMGIDPRFLAFLDADYFQDKLKIVLEMEDEMDDHLINQMAASIDVIIEDGPIYDRTMELEKCIRTRARYEVGRIR